MRDLLILILISPALKNLLDTIPVFTMSCASLFFICSIDIYLVRADALFFFSLGYIIFKRDIDFDLVDTIKYIDVLLPYTVGAFLQIFFPYFTYVISAFTILLGCVAVIKLSELLIKNSKICSYLLYLSRSLTFWMYAVHILVELGLIKLFVFILPINRFTLLVEYFIVPLLTVFISVFSGIICKKLFPKLFLVLTGERP